MPQTVIPQFRMLDARQTIPFYVEKLGFVVDWQHQFEPGFPLFVQLTREGQTIFLTEHRGDCEVGGAAYFRVADVNLCYEAFAAAGLHPLEPPVDQPWGARELLITDPNGNRLRFATNVT